MLTNKEKCLPETFEGKLPNLLNISSLDGTSMCWDIELNMAVSHMTIIAAVCSILKDHLVRLLSSGREQEGAKSIRSTIVY
jgi:hypothetical protein